MRAVIFANGNLSEIALDERALDGAWLIAADGGARHCLHLGLKPSVVIGDLDSLKPGEIETLQREGARFIEHPARKDYTDLELALKFALEEGAEEVTIFGALGARWDHTLANLLLPAGENFKQVRVQIIDANQQIALLHDGQQLVIEGLAGDIVSLLPLGGPVYGITTEGLEYPLHGESLRFGATRGVSNVMLSDRATVEVGRGLLLCVVIHTPR